MVQINLNSNIVNGIYSVVGVLMVMLLTHCIQVIVSCHNLHTIYDTRKPLRLKTTRLSLLMDPGLAPRSLSRLLALLAVLVTALITAGGFSFVGDTEPVYQTVYVRNKVVRATRGNYVDFRKHISSDGLLVSASFLLSWWGECIEGGFRTDTSYVRINDLDNLRDVKWPVHRQIMNSTCVYKANGFKGEILDSQKRGPLYATGTDCRSFLYWETIRQEDWNHTVAALDKRNCPYHDVEVRCSYDWSVECVGSMRVQDEFGGFSIFQLSIREGKLAILIYDGRKQERDDAEVLESMAFIEQLLQTHNLPALRKCASFRVEENASVQKLAGERNVTKMNVGLIMGTFGSAAALLLGVVILALVMWVHVVWLKGRQGYNCFSSSEDALACATQALHWSTDGRAERAGKGVIVKGVDTVD